MFEEMINYLRIIFYGLLAFIERNPIFCLILLLLALFAPFVFKIVGWIILGIIALLLVGIGVSIWRMRKMQREMSERFGGMGGSGFGSGAAGNGFGGFSYTNMGGGMSLEELVRQMQAQADAAQRAKQSGSSSAGATVDPTTASQASRKRVSDDVGDYVDFEEVKDK